ncbi:MAG TPA: copper chaperone PCu(A)C [Ramlibacter sp.]|uniref:copper chaperone PCu(A)C n=1 Tax=Ramlibacter sp. TaxID=1917967 RepID=UPI002ECFB20D
MKKFLIGVAAVVVAVAARAQPAPVNVEAGWARAVLPGQASSGAYMTFTAREPLTLTGASSPAAGIIEIHQMKMEGDVMKMRAVDTLALAPGKAVEFKPGGYHFMLMDLKAAFREGTHVPLTLQFRDGKGKARELKVSLPVSREVPAVKK